MKTLGSAILLSVLVFSASASEARQSPYESFSFRVYCTRDVDQITQGNANFSIVGAFTFASGDPWATCKTRAEFDQRLKAFQAFTAECKRRGITTISYVSKTVRMPEAEGKLFDIWKSRWTEYEDYFGPRPASHPKEWLAITAVGGLWGHVHVPPSQAATFVMPKTPTERAGCDLNPSFRQYLKGLIKIVCDTGVDGIYLDHTENKCGYCQNCRADFIRYLKTGYPKGRLEAIYGVQSLDEVRPPAGDSDPFWREFRKWRALTGAELHRFLRDYARTFNPNFIMSGNAYSANGFHSAIGSADMEMLGEVDDVPYSEIAVSSNFERGKARVPHLEGSVRISNSPHYKHFRAMVGLDKPILVYPLYPESPNPVPQEEALYPVLQLVVGEAVAHGLTFRRLEAMHSPYTLLGAFDFYQFLRDHEENYRGQRLYSDVAILSSLNQFYSRRYSYFYCASRALADAGIHHRIISEKLLTPEDLRPFKAVILPYVPLMTDAGARAISRYVQDGGSVVVLGKTSSHDELGQPRSSLLLAGILGFDGNAVPLSVQRREVGRGKVVFVPLPDERMQAETIDYGKRHSWFSRGEFPADLIPVLRSLPEEVSWATSRKVLPLLRNSGGTEVTLMKHIDGKRYLAHLVNYQVTIDGKVTPESNVLLTIPLDNGEKVRSVRLLSPDEPDRALPFVVRAARPAGQRPGVSVVVPKLQIYAAVELTLM